MDIKIMIECEITINDHFRWLCGQCRYLKEIKPHFKILYDEINDYDHGDFGYNSYCFLFEKGLSYDESSNRCDECLKIGKHYQRKKNK